MLVKKKIIGLVVRYDSDLIILFIVNSDLDVKNLLIERREQRKNLI